MEKNGYLIIKNVLTKDEIEHANDLLNKEFYEKTHMAHSDLLWYIRTRPSVVKFYQDHYRTKNLVTSFDGVSWKRKGEESWTLDWHIDQDGRHPPDFCVFQSTVALSDINIETGGIQFLKGSHKQFTSLMKKYDRNNDEWEIVFINTSEAHPKNEDKLMGLDIFQPSVNAGDMIVWDSRCVHRVVSGNIDTERNVAYMCFVPRYFVSKDMEKIRMDAFEKGISSTHWPHRFVDRGDSRCPPSKIVKCDEKCKMFV